MCRNEEFTFMSTSLDDNIDLSMRAPYIPMNENDDLPLLTEDLMWSAFSEEVSLDKDLKTNTEIQSLTSQPITSGNMDPMLMNEVQKTLSSIDGKFVSPILSSCINTKYVDSESLVTNRKRTVEEKLEHVQKETSIEDRDREDMTMMNNVISIDSEVEPKTDCGLESTTIVTFRDHSSENEKIQIYPIQSDTYMKNC